MKYFLDTEFIESGAGKPIHLISIGVVAETGQSFYAVNTDCPLQGANEWVKENVIPHLDFAHGLPLPSIREELRNFCRVSPEFWGYYADYDWVVFCQIFGTMMDLPQGWPMYCRDLKQWCDQLGSPKLPEQTTTEHNALNDARWNKTAWEFLAKLAKAEGGE